MKKQLFVLILFLIFYARLFAQEVPSLVNREWDTLKHAWRASWITHPTASQLDYGVFHLRKTFELTVVPSPFRVHVSADNRYRLYVNGQYVCNGPARDDLLHWSYETIDIAPYLQEGINVLAALVFNYGAWRPVSQHSCRTAFILQADAATHYYINTNDSWRIVENHAYQPIPISSQQAHGFYAVCPGDSVDGEKYPWGWQDIFFDDSLWTTARDIGRGVGRGYMHGEAWYLTPRSIPLLEEKVSRIHKVVRAENIAADDSFLQESGSLDIPPGKKVSLLLDQSFLTMGYPQLTVSGGKGSIVKLTYGEAMYDQDGQKGHRDDIDGKTVDGLYDVFFPDGGDNRMFEPLWLRTFRYIQLDITTADEPLKIARFVNLFTAYPFQHNASFDCDDPELIKIWQVGWRTARLCAQETYYDCPYYEQLQYIGDTRIQALISLTNSGDDRLMRKALELFDHSRVSEGITQSRYPSYIYQFIPKFSLWWVSMVHDFYMYRDDQGFTRQFLPGIKSVLDYFERRLDDNSLIAGIEWLPFVDWADGWHWGVPPGIDLGYSSIASLQYVYALQRAAELFKYWGETCYAEKAIKMSQNIQDAVFQLCYSPGRQLIADTPDLRDFSQHANILAVLTNTIPQKDQRDVMLRLLSDVGLTQCTLYFRFYLFRALQKAGLGDLYLEQLGPWKEALDYGLTTFPENPIGNTSVVGTRSDCHAWSASPNYDFLTTVCGIQPAEPGFQSVSIVPHLGSLKWIKAKMPHPRGQIDIFVQRAGENGITGKISLPAHLSGSFKWRGDTVTLSPGENWIHAK
ncbi:alpha-L-rhamnosidase [candidate division KSB1 bacterium]|nr:alpha-L-rhamnosidase N-terminal domain-containing protein [candidate division KSB1 bacterium]RQW07141.1 MAG: alpha-L-rhamnosidase [candidate division KSB1 bacterium]